MRDYKSLAFLITALLSVSSAEVSLDLPGRVVAVGDIHGDFNALVSILLKSKLIEEISQPDIISEQPEAEPIVETDLSVPLAHLARRSIMDDNQAQETGTTENKGRSLLSRFCKKVLGACASKTSEEYTLGSERPMPDWRIFQEARAEQYRWIGGEAVLVQTGDMVDRGPDAIAVYTLLKRLQEQAKIAGGEVIPLLGNHDAFNLCGRWEYVSKEDYATFGPLLSRAEQRRNRQEAFSKTGFLGEWIRGQDSVAKVGRVIYSHAGVLPELAGQSIPEINDLVREDIDYGCMLGVAEDPNGPLWNRVYAGQNTSKVCRIVTKVLTMMDADRMVIGHNPLRHGQILERCDGKLVLIDVAMSVGMPLHNSPAALEYLYTYTAGAAGSLRVDVTSTQLYVGDTPARKSPNREERKAPGDLA